MHNQFPTLQVPRNSYIRDHCTTIWSTLPSGTFFTPIKTIHQHTLRAPLKSSKHYKSIERNVNLECDLASTPKSYLPTDMFKSRTSNTLEIQPSPAALSGADSSNISSTQENIGSNKQLLKTRNTFYQTHSVQRSLLAGIH